MNRRCVLIAVFLAGAASSARAGDEGRLLELPPLPLDLQDAWTKGRVAQDEQGGPEHRDDILELPIVVVKPGGLLEEGRVGEYQQPVWTTRRRFPSTRVYLQAPPGTVQYEQWFELRKKKSGGGDETRLRQEFAFGLGHRLQLDLYLNEAHVRDGVDSSFDFRGYSAEVRYALADWGEIWGNPTVYFEYLFQNGEPDMIEPKLLLGGELGRGWHWGTNFIHERGLAARKDRVEEWAVSNSVSYTVVDQGFSVGATGVVAYASEPGTPVREYATEYLLGPSFQFIPHPRASIDIEPLFGLGPDSKRLKMFVVFSWRF